MDVVYFLPDHPTAPQSNALETLLPDLILTVVFSEESIMLKFNQPFGAETF